MIHWFHAGDSVSYNSAKGKRCKICIRGGLYNKHFIDGGEFISCQQPVVEAMHVPDVEMDVTVELDENIAHTHVDMYRGPDCPTNNNLYDSQTDSVNPSCVLLPLNGDGALSHDVHMDEAIVVSGRKWSISGAPPQTGEDFEMLAPFSGNFKGGSWNSQALLAAAPWIQQRKLRKAFALANSHDFYCYEETHSIEGKVVAFDAPKGMVCFWAHGNTYNGGVAIFVKEAFLKNFNTVVPERDFVIIVPGRVVFLRIFFDFQ